MLPYFDSAPSFALFGMGDLFSIPELRESRTAAHNDPHTVQHAQEQHHALLVNSSAVGSHDPEEHNVKNLFGETNGMTTAPIPIRQRRRQHMTAATVPVSSNTTPTFRGRPRAARNSRNLP